MQPFDLQKALNGAKLVTRDGNNAEGFRERRNGEFKELPILEYPYVVAIVGMELPCAEDGSYVYNHKHRLDLFLADPEPCHLGENTTTYTDDQLLELISGDPEHIMD